jgi:hypothetical protein
MIKTCGTPVRLHHVTGVSIKNGGRLYLAAAKLAVAIKTRYRACQQDSCGEG